MQIAFKLLVSTSLAAALLALSAQQAFAQDWTPANGGVPTALWLDANDASTITKDGGNLVSQWNDKSGNARHVTQATAANRPTYQAAGLNGKPAVYFDAASRYMASASASAHGGQWSVFAVVKQAGTGIGVILAQDGSSGTRIAQYARFSSATDIQTISFHSAGNSSVTQPGAVTSPCIAGSVCSSSRVTAYLNGAGGTAAGISGTLASGSRALVVGRVDWDGSEAYLNGYVSEMILVPSAVSDSDRQKFEGYLAWKWGTVASLPSGHPYKSAPPSAALSMTLTRPTSGQVIVAGSSVSATATATGGTPPYTVKFYLDGGGTPASTTPNATSPLTVNLGALSAGPHTVHATVTDSTSTTVGSGTAVPFSVIVDSTAPTPNPMAFAGNPVSNNATSLTMTAGIATDALSPPVQYYFENITNANNSGWISSPMWTNTGLTTDLTYSFRVKARDSATPPNETAFSSTLTGVPVKDPGLRCEDLVAPIGVDSLQPALSWQYEDTALTRGQKQSAYRILVASTAANLAANQGDLWDSGQVASEQSLHVPYAGTALTSRQRCHWKVRVWDKDGSPSAWSAPSVWTMGLLNPAAWTAKWIGAPASGAGNADMPYVRKTFNLAAIPTSALASVNVMGFYELYVNGVKVSPNIIGPALTNYGKRSLYESYDLVPYLRTGSNCIGLWLSRGWRDTPIARMQLDMMVNGLPLRIATGGDWRGKSSGRTLIGSWGWNDMGGEQVDARLDDPLWSDPATSDSDWLPVPEVAAPAIPAESQKCPPMRVLKTIPAVSISNLADGSYRVDFGTQLTGWLKLRLRGQAPGNTITIQYADNLEPLQTFNQLDRYICAGKPLEEFCSKFNYHGFRWAIIEGLAAAPELADAEALLIGADFETRGGFACSSDQFNRMHQVNLWTIRCLSQGGYLSDCPHRERWGYGDGQVSTESCMMNFMMQPFYSKWAADWVHGANPQTGYMPHTAPQGSGGGGPAWGGAGQALTWRNYVYYQDKRIVERNLDACFRHIEAIESHATDGVVRAFGGEWDFIGDWVPPGRGMDTNNWPPQPAAELFNNCYRLYLREQWAQMAEVLGRQDEANACRAELARLRPLVHVAFYDPSKQFYVLDEQAYYLMPLMTGVVPEELRPTIMNKLEECIRVTRRGHLDTGMLGTYFLMNYLMEMGRNDLLHLIVSQKEYPGWGYMLEQGATTWWEQWNGFYSRIHSCFTSLDGWFYQGLAGIRPDPANPGFKHIILKPAAVGDLTWVECHHDSPYGRIVSNWQRQGRQLTMEVTIPFNSTAEIHVPASAVEDVTESGQAVSIAPGVQFLRMENRHAVFAVGSGSYVFTGTLPATFGPVVDVPAGTPLDLDFLGSQTITTLLLGGAIQPPGTYNAISHPAWFTGTGSLLVVVPVVTPESRTWDNGAGTGKWNDTDANWTGQTWTPGAAATLAHGATASTITLSSGLTAGSVTIGDDTNNNANYTFTGGSLTATSFTLQGKTDNDLSTAGYPTTKLNNTSLSVTSLVTGRGQLVIDGSSTVTAITIGGPGGDPNGAWGQLTIAGTAKVTATNGFSAGTTAWGLNLNGGTLTTKGLDYGPHTYIGSTNLNFNGTLVKANQNNANFITATGGFDFNPQIQAGGAKIDTNGFDIGIQVPLAGSGALTKSGAGTLTLSGASTYTGKTSVVNGTLILAQAFLNHTAVVELTTSATLQLNFAATDTINKLLINGLPQASGTWGRRGHPTANYTASLITGNGLLQVTTGPAGGFAGWASTNGAIGQTPDQDHDNDGVENGIEYFMVQTGSSFTALPTLNAANTISWPADPAYQGTYEVQTSPDLATWTNVDPRPVPSGGTLSYTLPTGLGKQFVRLFVTPTT